MSWNDQGGDGKDKWGGGRDPDGPPDLDELFRRMKKKFTDLSKNGGGDGSSSGSGAAKAGFFGAGFIVIILLAMWLIAGIYIVRPPERAVVVRFGRYVRTEGPGPHWLPRFIESAQIVNIEQTLSEKYEAEMLTKDENIVSVEVSAFYRVADPRAYLFNVVKPLQSLQEAMRSATRQVVGSTTLDNILTTGREAARERVNDKLVKILDVYQTGYELVNVNLQDVRPPKQVINAFDDVNKAREDKDRFINEAGAYMKKVTSIVQGQVQQILRKARADSEQMVANASAGVAGYLAVLPEYESAPVVTRERMYLETIQSILSKSSKVLLDTKGSNNMMYIPLDKLLSLQKMTEQAKLDSKQMKESESQNSPMADTPEERRPTRNATQSRRGYQWR